jgi:hypothetical protein
MFNIDERFFNYSWKKKFTLQVTNYTVKAIFKNRMDYCNVVHAMHVWNRENMSKKITDEVSKTVFYLYCIDFVSVDDLHAWETVTNS